MDNEYFLKIEEMVVAYVYFKTDKGEVTEFAVKLLSLFGGNLSFIKRGFRNG